MTLQDDTTPKEAMQRVRQWRWKTVVRAHLSEELAAVKALGKLCQREGNPRSAIDCFVRAGNEDLATAAARELPDAHADLALSLLTPVEISRAAAFAAVAASADLIPDHQARDWGEAAILAVNECWAATRVGPSAQLKAFDTLAALSECLTEQQIATLLAIVEPLIHRTAGRIKFTDEAVTRILISIARRRQDAVPHLVRALLANKQMADIVLSQGVDVLAANKAIAEELLVPAANTNEDACLALILAGLNPQPAIALAQQEVAQFLIPRVSQPGVTVLYGGAQRVAVLARILDIETRCRVAQGMLDMALDPQEATQSRRNCLIGLTLLAPHLDDQTRDALAPTVLAISRGEHDGEPSSDLFFSGATLADPALESAARLATTDARHSESERVGIALLRTVDESGRWRVVRALSLAPAGATTMSLMYCAVHPMPAVRALAAVRWARNPAALPAETALHLAADEDHQVRLSLARALREHSTDAISDESVIAVVHALARDPRRQIRSYATKLGSESGLLNV